MNSYIKLTLSFVSGVVIGAIATKKYLEYKQSMEYYEEEEEDEVLDREGLSDTEKEKENEEEREEIVIPSTRESRVEYHKIKTVNDAEYTRLLNELKYEQERETAEILGDDMLVERLYETNIDRSKPYRIDEQEFESLDDFDSSEFTYYADGYLTDSIGFPVSNEDIDQMIGIEFEKYFDEGVDQVYIRNERLAMDFSIIRDLDNFVDVAPPRIKRMVGL